MSGARSMRGGLARALCALALLWACAADNQNGHAQSTRGSGSGSGSGKAPVAGKPAGANTPAGSKPMSGITTAFNAFRAFAAQKLGLPADQLEGGPNDEALGKMVKQRVGAIWALTMRKAGGTIEDELRGWSTNDGTVITLDQNLGLLFAEAGVWGGGAQPALTARELADRLAWSLGPRYSVHAAPPRVPSPALSLKDGAGTFSFSVNYREPGPGGAGGGPLQLTRIDIALTADRRAVATRTKVPSP